MSISQMQARLNRVREAIDTVLSGGVSSFAHEGGDSATLLSLSELQRLEAYLVKQISAARRRAGRFAAIRPVTVQ